MNVTQYGNYFYLYLMIILLIPAIILGFKGKSSKIYGLFLSFPMVYMILRESRKEMFYFLGFFGLEICAVYLYLYLRKKNDSEGLYILFLLIALSPLIASKFSAFEAFHFKYILGFIGISYLTFRTLGLIIEIKDGIVKEISFPDFMYFLFFFPTFSSGPVDRYRRFKSDTEKTVSGSEYLHDYLIPGLKKIVLAIVYKFVIAYLVNSYWMNRIGKPDNLLNIINYMYAYSMYLFFDFAGYSLFAVGTSYILKIKSPDNFNRPFLSKDMKEFWTRWHISLSKWFGDYVYSRLLLRFMRNKTFKNRFSASHVSQMITMLIMGFWHGLTSYYIIYGIYQGTVLILTDIFNRKSKFYKENKKKRWFQIMQVIVTFHIACFGLLIFSGYLFTK